MKMYNLKHNEPIIDWREFSSLFSIWNIVEIKEYRNWQNIKKLNI